jgi:protein-S-isoprenylcysteine O-methyltransferase Ste14
MESPKGTPTDAPVKPLLGIPPPIVIVLILGAGLGVHFGISKVLIFSEGWVQFAVGIPIILLGLGFGLRVNMEFNRVGTDDRFAEPTSQIVTTGNNARVRNPMYVGLVFIYLGIVLTVNAAWALAGLPILITWLHFGVILREEAYLEARFGSEYLDYKTAVPRWIPKIATG